MGSGRICSRVRRPVLCDHAKILTESQLSVPYELLNPQRTPKLAREIPSCPRLPIVPPLKTSSSSFPSPFSPSASRKLIPMKDMITPQEPTRRSASRASGRSRLSSSKNVEKNSTSFGSMRALKSSKSYTPRDFSRLFLQSLCSLSGQ
jgi:hypothetical protein